MSYADAAAKGPKQTAEEIDIYRRDRAPPQVSVVHSEDNSESLIDVDSEHVNTVPADFESQEVQTSTQADRLEHEAEDRERASDQAAHQRKKDKQSRPSKTAAAKAKAERAAARIRSNADNPVFLGNALLVTALSGALGFGAYKKYAAGELTWKVAGAWAGVVGLFSAADYYVSSYFVKNKYPPKK
ncbi:MAG: hypothetical protein M4579_003458 [Chaenotheca gracillima]|nr:MAG: hypothetical protein M4579_003458 [Chaenotheca gracillima]